MESPSMNNVKLHPCPFCAFPYPKVVILPRKAPERFTLKYMVVCDYRDGGCGAASGWCETSQEATESWNQRKRKYRKE